MSSVLTVDAIQRIVKIVTLLKHVQIVHGKNVVVGLVYINREYSKGSNKNRNRSGRIIIEIMDLNPKHVC